MTNDLEIKTCCFSTRYTHINKMRDDICSHKAVDHAFPAIEPTTVRDTEVSHSGEKIYLSFTRLRYLFGI